MHPRLYSRVSAEDEEQYSIDALYRTTMSKALLFSLAALPISPLQALPFLRTAAEVGAHALLARYLHGHGEEDERMRDQESGARAAAQAAVARGFLARTKLPSLRSHEEADFVSLDILLRPHLYLGEPAPRPADAPDVRSVAAGEEEEEVGKLQARIGKQSEEVTSKQTQGAVENATTSTCGDHGDASLGLVTYAHNLSAEAMRQHEGAFGHAVRKIFRRVFDFDAKQTSRSKREQGVARERKNATLSLGQVLTAPVLGPESSSRSFRQDSFASGIDEGTFDDSGAPGGVSSVVPPPEPPQVRVPGAKGIQLQGPWIRPPGGTIGLGYSRAQLFALLETPSAKLATRKDRRAQLLLRAYGADGGEWCYRTALAHPTPVVSGLAEIAEAAEGLARQLRERGDIFYGGELACAYPDGDDTNSAACAALTANGVVLVRANHSLEVLSVNDAPLRPGTTVDHTFEVPGSIFDSVGHGPRLKPASDLSKGPRIIVPPASACVGMGSPPPWQRTASSIDMVSIAEAEARARGIFASDAEAEASRLEQQAAENAVTKARIAAIARGSSGAEDTKTDTLQGVKRVAPGGAAETLLREDTKAASLKTLAEIETGVEGAQPCAVDITVTVAFHGSFVDHAYVLGRLTVALYREAFVALDDHPSLAGSSSTSAYAPAVYSTGEGNTHTASAKVSVAAVEGRVVKGHLLEAPLWGSRFENKDGDEKTGETPSHATAHVRRLPSRPTSVLSHSSVGLNSRGSPGQSKTPSGPVNPLPAPSDTSADVNEGFDAELFAGPGLPRRVGTHELEAISGPPGLAPVRVSRHVASALLYPNDVDPVALARSVRRRGDLWRAPKKSKVHDGAVMASSYVAEAIALEATRAPSVKNAPTAAYADSVLTVDDDDPGHASEPEPPRESVLFPGRNAARHSRQSRLVSVNAVRRMEARMELRRKSGTHFHPVTKETSAASLLAPFSHAHEPSRAPSVFLRQDGTIAASADEPGAMPSSLVAAELFRDESLGSDVVGTALSKGTGNSGVRESLQATGVPALLSSTTQTRPQWRSALEGDLKASVRRPLVEEGVDRARAAAGYFSTSTHQRSHRRASSLDASAARMLTSRLAHSLHHSSSFEADSFVVPVPSHGEAHKDDLFPSFPAVPFHSRGTAVPIGVGASSGAGDGDGGDENKHRPFDSSQRAPKLRIPKRPLTYHPSQAPPLSRLPPTNLLPSVPQDQVIACSRFPVGCAVASACTPNTVDSFGRIVIRHEPLHCPVLPGRYIVSVSGLSAGSYSVSVTCSLAYPAHTIVEGAVRAAASSKPQIVSARTDVASIVQSQRLGTRKRQLVGHLIRKTDAELQELQGAINRLRASLDEGVVLRMELGSDDEDSFDTQASEAELKSQVVEDKSGRKVDEDGDSVDGSSESDEEGGGSAAARERAEDRQRVRRLKKSADEDSDEAMASAILIARRKRQRLEVTDSVRSCIRRRLAKLDRSMATAIRVMHTRRREYGDISDGLEALAEARARREADLLRLLSQSRDYARNMAPAARALLLAATDPVTGLLEADAFNGAAGSVRPGSRGAAERVAALEKLGISNAHEILSLSGRVAGPSTQRAQKGSGESARMLEVLRSEAIRSGAASVSAEDTSTSEAVAEQAIHVCGPDGISSSVPSGACVALVKLVRAKRGTPQVLQATQKRQEQNPRLVVEYHYHFPQPDFEAAVYSQLGPLFLLWKTKFDADNVVDVQPTPADVVRAKAARPDDLSEEELKWVSLDRVLHPDLYAFGVSSEEGEGVNDLLQGESSSVKSSSSSALNVGSALSVNAHGSVSILAQSNSRAAAAIATVAGVASNASLQLPPSLLSTGTLLSTDSHCMQRFDLGVAAKAILKAVYLSVEDKVGLRGNHRDVGKQATALQVKEGDSLSADVQRRRAEMEEADAVLAMSGAERAAYEARLAKEGRAGLESALPAAEGGLGWSRGGAQRAANCAAEVIVAGASSASLDALVPKCEYTRSELVRIRTSSIQQLGPEERAIRKLLLRFHEFARSKAATSSSAASSPSHSARQAGTVIGPDAPARDMIVDARTGTLVFPHEASLQARSHLSAQAQAHSLQQRFQAVGSNFAVARAAVPIPLGAPFKLRRALQERSSRLQALWSTASSNMQRNVTVDQSRRGGVIATDVDERARDLLDELDRVNSAPRPQIDSAVLHGLEQRFSTAVLLDQLEMELDRVLLSQVFEREAIERTLLLEAADAAAEAAARRAAAEAKALRDRREATIARMLKEEERRRGESEAESIARGRKVILTVDEMRERERLRAVREAFDDAAGGAGKKQRAGGRNLAASVVANESSAETSVHGDGHMGGVIEQDQQLADWRGGDYVFDRLDPLKELGGLTLWGDPLKPMTPRRAARLKAQVLADKERREAELSATRSSGTEVIGGRLAAITSRRRAEKAAERNKALNRGRGSAEDDVSLLLPGQCRACLSIPCRWQPCLGDSEVDALRQRQELVEKELYRMRRLRVQVSPSKEKAGVDDSSHVQVMIRCEVALSHLRGGPARQTKEDIVFELAYELSSLKSSLRLCAIDAELHGVYASHNEEVTIDALHGYPQQTWRSSAIVQLESEVGRLVARSVAGDVLDDALEFMMEGWHFGERASSQIVAGYVPALNGSRPLRPFEATSNAARLFALQGPTARARATDAARGLRPAIEGPVGAGAVDDGDPNVAAVASLARLGLMTMSLEGRPLAIENRAASLSIESPPDITLVFSAFGAESQSHATRRYQRGNRRESKTPIPLLTRGSAIDTQRSNNSIIDLTITSAPAQRDETMQTLPPGFFRVEDEAHAARLRAALRAQSALHELIATGSSASHQFEAALSSLRLSESAISLSKAQPARSLSLAIVPSNATAKPGMSGSRATGLQSAILTTTFGARMAALPLEALGAGVRPSREQYAAGIAFAAEARAAVRAAIAAQARVLHSMEETEVTLRYGMFLLALMYFRIMNQLARLRSVLSGDKIFADEAGEKVITVGEIGAKGASVSLGLSASSLSAMTAERRRIVEAEAKMLRREGAKAMANARAAAGFAAVHARRTALDAAARLESIRVERKRIRQTKAALKIQSVFRGVRVRKTIGELRARKNAHAELAVLKTFAAMRIQALWRGYVTRALVRAKRSELENFIKYVVCDVFTAISLRIRKKLTPRPLFSHPQQILPRYGG